jgi:hypothetical protein
MKRYIVLLLLIMSVGFMIQKLIIVPQIPESNFSLMPLIPLFFVLLGLGSILILTKKPNPSVFVLLGIKSVKILLSLAFILIYVLLINKDKTAFLFSMLAYFITYLLFETWMLSTMNKKTRLNDE